jgi:hypothetical protein
MEAVTLISAWEFWHDARLMALILTTGFFFLLMIKLYGGKPR